MANVQIYQLDNAGSDLDNSALLAMDIPNPDTSAASEVPYVTRKESIASLETQMLQTEEYSTALDTTNTTIVGAINENKSVIGYSYDEYDATTAYSKGDLCIYNNVLYKAKQATTGNLPTNTTYWEQTSIADEINELNTNKADNSDIPTKTSDLTNDSGFPVATNISWGQSLSVNYIKSNFLLFVSNRLFALWFYGSGYSNVDIRNLGTNDVSSGTGSVTMDIITITRTSNGFTVTTNSNATITVIG